MVFPSKFIDVLNKNGVNFFTGVPDSILKNLTKFLDKKKNIKHIIAANEGSAISLAIGYNLSTNKIPCVYLQNSGLGNAFNPIASISHKKIYSIPMLLIIGWRGASGQYDEPQHMVMGKITKQTLKMLDINYTIIKKKPNLKILKKIINQIKNKKKIHAILIKNNYIENETKKIVNKKNKKLFLRSSFLKYLLTTIPKNGKLISTTGYTSREIFQLRKKFNLKKGKDFYMIGGMGHASMVSLGYSLNSTSQTICVDGDGSLFMHMGSLVTVGVNAKKNFKHIILNNYCHESVGGQKTYSEKVNFKKLFISLGYKKYFFISDLKLKNKKIIKKFLSTNGPSLLEVSINEGTMENLMRPSNFLKIKKYFQL